MEKPKTKVEIPVLAAGSSNSSKMSKEFTIRAIEAKLKSLEQRADDFVINKTTDSEPPLIQRYQYNKNSNERGSSSASSHGSKYNSSKGKYSSGPYNTHQRRHKRWTPESLSISLSLSKPLTSITLTVVIVFIWIYSSTITKTNVLNVYHF